MFPVVLTETMLQQVDMYCRPGIIAEHKKKFTPDTDRFAFYIGGETLRDWKRKLSKIDDTSLDALRTEVEEAFQLYDEICDMND